MEERKGFVNKVDFTLFAKREGSDGHGVEVRKDIIFTCDDCLFRSIFFDCSGDGGFKMVCIKLDQEVGSVKKRDQLNDISIPDNCPFL